ncbi:rhodopsin, GQ-coupled-like [Lytechinus variegatus]|uniref:rhodopsin, GQ-coupled-like n=1 Tax=Lytechinus variegatus TaxID=7654 RepID=UPI001BB26A76|nr:rhodopsin, GQ-coupled-like [Lytechinus variegatus]
MAIFDTLLINGTLTMITEIETELAESSSLSMLLSSTMSSREHTADVDVDIISRHRTIVAVIWCIVAAIGLFGNALVVVSVVVDKKLQTTTNILVVNLAIADFLTCLCLPVECIMLLRKQGTSPIPNFVCAFVGGTIYTCILCSISTLVAIAFIRWYVITKSVRVHQGILTPKKNIVVAVAIWVESLLITLVPSLFGIVEFGHSKFYSLCSIRDENPLRVYYILLQGVILIVALLAIGVFYALIMAFVLRHNRDLRARLSSSSGNNAPYNSRNTMVSDTAASSKGRSSAGASGGQRPNAKEVIHKREVAITKNLIAVVCVFAICYLPTGISLVIPGAGALTLYAMMIGLANNALNPIIYALKHPIFQGVFKSLLLCRVSSLSSPEA